MKYYYICLPVLLTFQIIIFGLAVFISPWFFLLIIGNVYLATLFAKWTTPKDER